MKLTPKQERFCQCIADGMSQADAYRNAFDVKPTTKPETTQANASRLMADSMVSARVKELRDMLTAKAIWTREDSAKVLSEIALGHDEQGKTSDRVAAVKELNAMHGFHAPTKVAQTDSQGNDVQPEAQANAVLAALARKHKKTDADT